MPASSTPPRLLACLLGALATSSLAAQATPPDDSGERAAHGWSRERKAQALNLGIVAGVTAYGFAKWDWGETSFRSSSEGWFGSHTDYGGADKLGHAYTGAVATALTAGLYRRWG